jgi:hypothetical protein
MTDRESYIENAPPLGMGPDGKLNFVVEGAPRRPSSSWRSATTQCSTRIGRRWR